MSLNQIWPDRSDNPLYRPTGRSSSFNHPRPPSATLSKPGLAGANASNRRFKKNSNAQGGQQRGGVSVVNSSDFGPRGLLNGAHLHPPSPELPDAPVSSTVTKPTEFPATQRSRTVPAPQSATLTSDTITPVTPTKVSGDQLKGFSFQFGTISPVALNKMPGNKMQIPDRTSSAPPNLDEQKGDQARHQSFQNEPHRPTTLAPKQQALRKDSKAVAQHDIAEAPPLPKPKVSLETSPVLPTNESQKPSVLSMSGIPLPKPFQQPQVHGSFAGPSQQIQPQAITATSLHMPPMPIRMQMGSTQMHQQIYVPGLPPHQLQPQGIIHQQGLGFTAQIAPQLPPQSWNLGINISTPQYPQQPGGKYVGQRKSSIRITDPKTREEVKFDSKRTDVYTDSGSSGSRTHPNALPLSQPPQPYTQMNYFHSSYHHGPQYFPAANSIPLASGHIPPNSQAQRFNYRPTQTAQAVTFMNPSTLSSLPSNKIGSSIHGSPDPAISERIHEGNNIVSPSPPSVIHLTVKPPAVSIGEKGTRDKSVQEIIKAKRTATRSKKKFKNILQKTDAAGTTSDLYMAYKGPDEKKETVHIPEGTESSSSGLYLKQLSADSLKEDVESRENKNVPDDWEDAADILIPELETSNDMKQMRRTLIDHKDGNENVAKEYSRDFLRKFAEQFIELPQGFEVTPDMESLMSINHDSYSSLGRVDRPPSAGSRADRRGGGMVEDERRSRITGPFIPGRDQRMDLGFTTGGGIRPGLGPNFGVLRNPRVQAPFQYGGGILSGPMQSVNSQGGLQNGSDADMWQRGTNWQHKGLIPSPQNPLNTMHEAGKQYEVGTVSDEEAAKQRQLKAILNKLTPQNFEKLFEQVKALNIAIPEH